MGPSTSQRAGGRCAASPYNDLCKNHVNEAARLVSRYGRFLTATRHAMSLLKPLRRMVATGGEIFARTAKTPHPTVGLLRGGHCDAPRRLSFTLCRAACIIEPRKTLINDAACRGATKSPAPHGGYGRGNLRENREDPAPTVGIAGRAMRRMRH